MAAHELGSVVIKEALRRAQVQPSDVSEVILGQVLTAGKPVIYLTIPRPSALVLSIKGCLVYCAAC